MLRKASAKRLSKVFWIVSVKTSVPTGTRSPRMTASAVRSSRVLWARMPLSADLEHRSVPELLHAVEHPVGRRLAHLVDDPAVGEEHAPGRRRPAAIGSWVTITMVWPSSFTASRMNARISAPLRQSRLPVGSSAKMICGRGWPAPGPRRRAAAGRRRARSAGGVSRSPRPTVSTTRSSHPGRAAWPARASGSVMFSSAVERRHQVEGLEDEADPVPAQPGELPCRRAWSGRCRR